MRGVSSKTRIETPENIKILDILKSMRGGSSKTRIETLILKYPTFYILNQENKF